MNQDYEDNYRIQVYIRREGETISFGDEFKSEDYRDDRELDEVISEFRKSSLASLEEEGRDENIS